jgi:hypothetical protein
MPVSIDGPVGLRGRTQNVTNYARDQEKLIRLLATIPDAQGGKKDSWPVPPLAGPDRTCPKEVADAIWSFQVFWKAKGVLYVVDGVADPDKSTLRTMNELVASLEADEAAKTQDVHIRIFGDASLSGQDISDTPSAQAFAASINGSPGYQSP